MANIKAVSLSNLVVNTRDYKKEYDWIFDKTHHCYYGLLKSERTDDIKSDLATRYINTSENPDYYEGCVIMPELQEYDICDAAEYLRDWCNKNQIPYKEDLDQYKRVEAWYWGYDDVV